MVLWTSDVFIMSIEKSELRGFLTGNERWEYLFDRLGCRSSAREIIGRKPKLVGLDDIADLDPRWYHPSADAGYHSATFRYREDTCYLASPVPDENNFGGLEAGQLQNAAAVLDSLRDNDFYLSNGIFIFQIKEMISLTGVVHISHVSELYNYRTTHSLNNLQTGLVRVSSNIMACRRWSWSGDDLASLWDDLASQKADPTSLRDLTSLELLTVYGHRER